MTRTRTEVVAAARGYAAAGTYFGPGHCLMFSRLCAGASGGVYDANDAWANARYHHPGGDAPAGTFVFWQGSAHGHVAVSIGGGRCISTDILRSGRADEVSIGQIYTSWRLLIRGWTEDLNGVLPIDDTKEWFQAMNATDRAELRAVVDNALAAALTADNPALLNAVRVAIEAERQEDAQAVADRLSAELAADTALRTTFRQNVRVPVDAELTQRHLGTES